MKDHKEWTVAQHQMACLSDRISEDEGIPFEVLLDVIADGVGEAREKSLVNIRVRVVLDESPLAGQRIFSGIEVFAWKPMAPHEIEFERRRRLEQVKRRIDMKEAACRVAVKKLKKERDQLLAAAPNT